MAKQTLKTVLQFSTMTALNKILCFCWAWLQCLWPRDKFTLMRSCLSKATLLASLMVSHTKAFPQTNCTTFLSWAAPVPALTCTTSTTILDPGTSLSRSFRGLTWAQSSDGYHWHYMCMCDTLLKETILHTEKRWQLHLLFNFAFSTIQKSQLTSK